MEIHRFYKTVSRLFSPTTDSAATQKPETLELLAVSPHDYAELSAYLSSFQRETEDPHFWTNKFYWWWENNPAFSAATHRGWILREGGKIVGFLGNIPSYFQLFGEEVVAFASTTWRVLPEKRSSSLSLLLRQMDSAKGSILFNTTPSPKLYKILETFGFQSIPRETHGRAAIIINVARTLESQLGTNIEVNLLGRPLSLALGIMRKAHARSLETKILSAVESRGLKKLATTILRVDQLFKADSSFDQLWEQTKNKFLNTNVRTADAINWLCFGDRNHQKSLLACYRDNRLVAYMVCRTHHKHKLKVLECLDLWGDVEEKIVLKSLVHATREYAVKNSCDLVTYPLLTFSIRDCLRKLGLLERKAPERQEYLRVNSNNCGTTISTANSYFAYCQGDRGSF